MFKRNKKQTELRETRPGQGKTVRTYSYHNVRNDQEYNFGRNIKKVSLEQLKSARKLWFEKFGLIILAIVAVFSLFSVLYLSNSSVVILQSSGSNQISLSYKEQVQKAANKLLASSILNSNKITIDTRKINSSLASEFPMYASISISLPLIDHHPVIYLTAAQPALTLNNSLGQYLLNENGQIMLRSPISTNFNYLKLPQIADQTANYLNIGQQILTNQEVVFIQTVIYELSLKADKVSNMTLPQGTAELNVYLLNQPYYIKFNLNNNDPKQQVGSFLATQNYLKSQNTAPSQYVDVRTDGRVFYQ